MKGPVIMGTQDQDNRRLMREVKDLRRQVAELKNKEQSTAQAMQSLRQGGENYRTLVRNSLSGFFIIQEGKFQYVTQRMVKMLGYLEKKELLGLPFWTIAHPDHREMVKQRGLQREKEQIEPNRYSFKALKMDGEIIWVDILARHSDYKGRPAVIGNFIDITEQKIFEQELRDHRLHLEEMVQERTAELKESNLRLEKEVAERREIQSRLVREKNFAQSVIDSLPGVFYVLNRDGYFTQWNRTMETITGYSHSEMAQMSALDLYRGKNRDFIAEKIVEVFETGRARDETELTAKNGDSIAFLQTGVRMDMPDGEYLVGMGIDITQRKKAEETLRRSERELRVLSERLLETQEMERKRVARELHDGIGQTLTAIKFGLENAQHQMEHKAIHDPLGALSDMVPTVQQAVEEVRRISRDLRPSILDDLGILATLKWFCREFHKVYGHIQTLRLVEVEEAQIPKVLKTVVYRIVQEALNNVAKHSGAKQATVTMRINKDNLELIIVDDGQGFDLAAHLLSETGDRGFGLASMRERAELSGGSVHMNSQPGQGTTIRALWPLTDQPSGSN